MFEAVIFDLDGVLTETEGIHMQMARRVFKQVFNYDLTEADLAMIVAHHPSEYAPKIAALRNLDLAKVPEFMDLHGPVYDEIWEQQVQLLPGVRETLSALKGRGVIISLATNSDKSTVANFLNKFNFQGVFDRITSGDEVAHKKPDPEIYSIAKGKLNLPTDKILVIEDSEPGVLSANAAGLKVAAVYNQYTAHQDFSKADYHFKTLSEILALF